MPEENPQLTHISDQIDIIIELLKAKAESSGPIPPIQDILPPDSRLLESSQGRREESQAANRTEEVTQVVQQAEPVRITDIAPRTLGALGEAIGRSNIEIDTAEQKENKGFLSTLLGTIGAPLLALAAGITALLAAANIDFGSFEGFANIIGKQGLMGGLKVFLKPFAKFAGKRFLKAIPVIGGLVSFYFAYERFQKGQIVRGTIDLVSGLLNLVGTFIAPGLANGLAIGLDIFNAYLDYEFGEEPITGAQMGDLIGDMQKWIYGKVGPTIKHAPIIGSFLRGADAYQYFKEGRVGMGLTESLAAIMLLMPGIGQVASLGLSVMQSIFSDDVKNEDPLSASITSGDWWSNLGEGFMDKAKEWYQALDEDGWFKWIVDKTLPDSWVDKLSSGRKPKSFAPSKGSIKSATKGIIPDDKTGVTVKEIEMFELEDGSKIEISESAMEKLTIRELNELLQYDNWSDSEVEMIRKVIREKKNPVTRLEKKMKGGGNSAPCPEDQPPPSKDFIDNFIESSASQFAPTKEPTSSPSTFEARQDDIAIEPSPSTFEARQDGGVISPGVTYLTGEKGPELVQTSQSGVVHSNEDIIVILKQNNEILTNLSDEIVTAVRETGTVINSPTTTSVVNNSPGASSIDSFRESAKKSIYR